MCDLSICIPTYNRSYYLDNCLNSIKLAKKETNLSLEICISDNCSTEKIEPLLDKYKDDMNIIFNKNVKDAGVWQYNTDSTNPTQPATAPNTTVATTSGGSVLMNASGATGDTITQTMLCRTTFSVVNKATDDTLQITWSVQLKDTATP